MVPCVTVIAYILCNDQEIWLIFGTQVKKTTTFCSTYGYCQIFRSFWAKWRQNFDKFILGHTVERFSRAGPRGRGREWATLGIHPRIHPLSWLLSNNRLEKVPFVSVLHTSSNRLLLSNQDKGCTPSVAHSLPLPLGPALLNLWTNIFKKSRQWEFAAARHFRSLSHILPKPCSYKRDSFGRF